MKHYKDTIIGCNYLFEHIEEWDKYEPEIIKLLNKLNEISEKIPNASDDHILLGFEIGGE